MQAMELKISKIGNSRGVRIPASVLREYAFADVAIMTTGVDGILLRPKNGADAKMSWEETAKAMAEAAEDWSEWDVVDSDGLADIPWQPEKTEGRRGKRPVSTKTRRRSS